MTYKAPLTLVNVLKHLYKLKDDFPYSQLALCLDAENLFNLMRVFGGQKIYIPKTEELVQLIQFCIIEEIGDYDLAKAANSEVLRGFTKKRYNRMFEKIHNRAPETSDQGAGDDSEVE